MTWKLHDLAKVARMVHFEPIFVKKHVARIIKYMLKPRYHKLSPPENELI